jgi:hypothetical protein
VEFVYTRRTRTNLNIIYLQHYCDLGFTHLQCLVNKIAINQKTKSGAEIADPTVLKKFEFLGFSEEASLIVETRFECGWWIGGVLELGDSGSGKSRGTVLNRGYFPSSCVLESGKAPGSTPRVCYYSL